MDDDNEELLESIPKQQSNIEFINELMDQSKYGGLVQAFVLEALGSYSRQMIEYEGWGERGIISFKTWQEIAKEIASKIEAKYGKQDGQTGQG